MVNQVVFFGIDEYSTSPQANQPELSAPFSPPDKRNEAIQIWRQDAPKWSESNDLIKKFITSTKRRELFIGRIPNFTAKDRQGLKNLVNANFKLKIWTSVSKKVHDGGSYTSHLEAYLDSIEDECKTCPNSECVDYTEQMFCPISMAELGNTLMMVNGRLFRTRRQDDGSRIHAERFAIKYITENLQTTGMSTIDIYCNNSPCEKCCRELNHLLRSQNQIIFRFWFGHVYRLKNNDDFEGLVRIRSNPNAQIQLWTKFTRAKYMNRVPDSTKAYWTRVQRRIAANKK